MFRNSKTSSMRKSNRKNRLPYEMMEERRMLTVSAIFGNGELQVSLDQSFDEVVISQTDGNVTVNGQFVDGDASMEGVQPVAVSSINSFDVMGGEGGEGMLLLLDGDFNDGSLQSIEINNLNQVILSGDYVVQSFDANLEGPDSLIDGAGRLEVSGELNVAGDESTSVFLDNPLNDFQGRVNLNVGGSIALGDANDISLGDISAANLAVIVGGTVTGDAPNIVISSLTRFGAQSVDLTTEGGVVDLFFVVTNTSGDFALSELDTFSFVGLSSAGSLNVDAGGLINMARTATLNVAGDATFDSTRIRLGVGGSNTFNAGRINFNTILNAFIWEDSSTLFFGDNSAADLDILSTGLVSNDVGATITVDGIASFQSTTDVSIGNAAGDLFNAGEIRFFAADVNISEDSATVIGGLANRAVNLNIASDGTISDSDEAYIFIVEDSIFVSQSENEETAVGIEIGDAETDFFQSGSISFQVPDGNVTIFEDDSTQIGGVEGFVNTATASNIVSTGTVINATDSVIEVAGNARFEGSFISIGQMAGDNVQLGTVTFFSNGDVRINENGDIILVGDSFVGGDLLVFAEEGTIADAGNSFLTVVGQGFFIGREGIVLGDLPVSLDGDGPTDFFDVGSLRFLSAVADASFTVDGDIVLTGESNTMTLRLQANGNETDTGTISNEEGVDLNVAGNLLLTAIGDIDLGSNPTDSINFDNLNFNSLADVAIAAEFEDEEDSIFIFGTTNNPNQAASFDLTTNVDVFDGTNAVIEVDEFFRIAARNIVLGDTETDCVDIPEGAIFETTSGVQFSVLTDESC